MNLEPPITGTTGVCGWTSARPSSASLKPEGGRIEMHLVFQVFTCLTMHPRQLTAWIKKISGYLIRK